MSVFRMTDEQHRAHQARVKDARKVQLLGTEEHAREEVRQERAKRPRKERPPKLPKKPEKDVLRDCIALLERHPKVAFWWRQNTGGARLTGNIFVKFSFRGASDLMFVLRGGQFGACECKATGKKPSAEQAAFLANVSEAGGLAVCVDHSGKLALALGGTGGAGGAS